MIADAAAAIPGSNLGAHLQRLALRVSLTDACNFRCRYCRPDASGAAQRLSPEEVLGLVGAVHSQFPLRKLRLTGGEPLLYPDLAGLIRRLGDWLPDLPLGVTSNGFHLAAQAQALRAAGLQRINVSIDAATPEAFARASGGVAQERVLAGLAAARAAGLRLRLNCVLQESINGDQLPALLRLAARYHAEIRFIELMPIGAAVSLSDDAQLDSPRAQARLAAVFRELGPCADSDTARRRRYAVDGQVVTVGFITTVSDAFCGSCDRYRLDAQGRLWQCLRSDVHTELMAPWREGESTVLLKRIRDLVHGKNVPDAVWTQRNMAGIGG